VGNEECCDWYPWVEPVYDFHDSFVTCEQWEALATRAVDFAADMMWKCDNWRAATYEWKRIACIAINGEKWAYRLWMGSLALLALLMLAKALL
jgi:hypothetical protein